MKCTPKTLLAWSALPLVLGLGPFLIPVPPLKDALPPERLADPDSRFIDVRGLRVHYKTLGAGEPTFVLLHGLGANTFSWQQVLAPLARHGRVIAFDTPGFGLTSRPVAGDWQGASPYGRAAQAALTAALLDALAVERAILVGHSAGGATAFLTALQHPRRVQALVLVAPAIYSPGAIPPWAAFLLRSPQGRRLGPLFMRTLVQRYATAFLRRAWHAPERITAETVAGYWRSFRVQGWDRALWELLCARTAYPVAGQVARLHTPTLVIAGDDDRIVPTAHSIHLAEALPDAKLELVSACGHIPQEERPERFLEAVEAFLGW